MKKKTTHILQGISIFMVILIASAIYYIQDDYDATTDALSYMTSTSQVNVHETSAYVAFEPISELQVTTGIIFFQGGKVDHLAYAPMLHELATHPLLTVSVISPFRLAMFGLSVPPTIISDYPYITNWIMMGHSLGGVFAATFSYENDSIDGLILLASYVSQDYSKSEIPILSITASEDEVLNQEAFNGSLTLMAPKSTYVTIEGGNHAQFGCYGPQQGDGTSLIDPITQQGLVVESIQAWIVSSFS